MNPDLRESVFKIIERILTTSDIRTGNDYTGTEQSVGPHHLITAAILKLIFVWIFAQVVPGVQARPVKIFQK